MQEPPKNQPTVLSADDDENAHLLLSMAFGKAGLKAKLLSVDDGSEVIRYLSGEGKFSDRNAYPWPNLLLLDLKMPKVSGFGVLEFIRKRSDLKAFPVIVFSSSDNEGDVKKAYALGCQSYVVKPASFEKLVELARAISIEFFAATPPEGEPEKIATLSKFAVEKIQSETEVSPEEPTPQKRSPQGPEPEIYRLLIEQVKDYAIFMLNKEGYIQTWNEGARRIKGYEAHEIIGKHFSVFYSQYDRENQKPEFELRMAQDMGRYEEEGWRIRKDGSRFWANVIVTPLFNTNGKLFGFAKVTRDLTQRKIQEDSLQKLLDSEERFRLLVDQVKDYAIFMLDAKGNITSWNQGARRLKGYTADEILGKHFSTFYTPQDIARDHPARELSIAIREGRYEEEGWRVKKGGSRFWASVVITALWDKRGNLTGFAKVTKDLTSRKREEDLMRQRAEELEAFAHTLSHDLRAPLRAISSFAHLLTTDADSLSEKERGVYVDKISKSAKAMDVIINDVLKLSQISLAPVVQEQVSLSEVFTQCLSLLEADIQKTGAQIEIKGPLPVVKANHTLLVQVFANLLTNALKFSRKGEKPRVEVYGHGKNSECEIHVKDNGVGIPEEFHQTIFKAFERGPAGAETSGTGVGLAIVKKATERLGGNISVRSAPGQGSDFVVVLPCEFPQPVTKTT